VSLTDLGADSLARYLGPGVSTVDGKLLYATDSALQLSVNTVAMRSGQEQYWKGEAVSLPRIAIAHVEQRKVSWLRTALVGGAALAVLASIKVSGVANGGGNTNGGGHNPE
jgi:hypothetical protein